MSSPERLAAQPPHEDEPHQHQEQLKSFNMLASVNRFRADLAQRGRVLPETREQVFNEEASFLVEGANRASRTKFELKRQGGHLVYFHEGQWRPYQMMLQSGIEAARMEARADHTKGFLYHRAERDAYYGDVMQNLRPGDAAIWDARYPYKQEKLYGKEFIRSIGMNPDRKMGFIYRAFCQADGSVVLESQSVDNSDDKAFDAALTAVRYDAQIDLDTLVRVYDGTLMKRHGGQRYYAGRPGSSPENAWNDIQQYHSDLAADLVQGLENIAHMQQSDYHLEREAKKHIASIWKAFKTRLENGTTSDLVRAGAGISRHAMIQEEKRIAYRALLESGEQLIGCGGAISLSQREENLLNSNPADIFKAIFGDKKTETYKFDKQMYCVVCQAPPSKKEQKTDSKKKCGPCGICKECDKKLSTK